MIWHAPHREVQRLAEEPQPAGSEKLFGENGYRIRQGDYRILYLVDDRRRAVEILEIGHRREVHRN